MEKNSIVAVCGKVGSGKSASMVLLQKRFPVYGHYSTGDAVRMMAEKEGVHIDDYNQYLLDQGRSFDEIVDGHLAEINNGGGKMLVDSRLGALFMPRAFKVLLTVDPELAAERRLRHLQEQNYPKNKHLTFELVLEKIITRDRENDERYARKYNGFRIADEGHYDLVIPNTKTTALEDIADEIEETYKLWLPEALLV